LYVEIEAEHNAWVLRSPKRFVRLVLALGLCAASCRGEIAENYMVRLWQTQDGLPEQTVQAVAQTRDGYLWIGTTGGLLRFDGSRFMTFERGNTPALKENSVFSLMTSRDGTLWIGTEGGGLVRLDEGGFTRFSAADGLSDGFVRTVLEDRRGKIWIGTDNGLFQLANSRATHATRVDNTPQMAPLAIHALAEARDGTVWVGGSRLVAIRAADDAVGGQVARNYPLKGEYSETRVKSILQTSDGVLWVGTVSGLQQMRPGSAGFERFAGIQSTVRILRETDIGTPAYTLWIGTIGQGAFLWHEGRLAAAVASKALPSNTVLTIYEDSERNVWMGTQAGMLRFSRSPLDLVPLPNASDSDFETISPDRDGSLWVASTRLSHLIDGVATPYTFPELRGARVRQVFRDRTGALWIGTDGRGLFCLTPGAAPKQYTTANGLVNNFVRSIMQARNGDLWIATDEGVSRLSAGSFRNFTVQDGLAYFSVRALLEDRAGDVWIGTDRGLSLLHGERFVENAATRALKEEKVWAVHESDHDHGQGTIWLGTHGDGLFRFKSSVLTHYTTEEGLASNSIYSILEDNKGTFWIGGASGVMSVSIHELEDPERSPHAYLSQRFFGVSEAGGLSPLYGGTQPAAAITQDGEVWFPTTKGPVRILARDVGTSTVPKVFVDQVVADGRTLPARGVMRLAADNANLEISYGSILLGPQDAVQFQYKLDGFDRDWRYASTRRVADYTNLPAGQYTFRVRAFEGGLGRETEKTLTIVKSQYFYRTPWFVSCCVAFIALIAWGIHYQRLRRLRMAFQAVIEERARLAREMHDTLIQGCAGVSLLLEACASAKGGDNAVQLELVDYARTQLAASIDEARQAVWNLRGTDSSDFGDTLRKLAQRTERGSSIAVECTVEGDEYDFHSIAMHEITMVSREAVYNALLHANPTRIAVHANFGEEEFSLRVEDDGSGFEYSRIAPEGHYGLLGIEERIKRLGGTVQVNSAASRGTRIFIRVPRMAVDRRQEHIG
jgi:ligand-binding sensor domain-containing protein/signal transduction histidine kinase